MHKSTIRTEGSYLYEEFLPTDGFDIKVYTVGEDYAHAEARRCPSIDGKVQRDETTGKEIRYPVNLNHAETYQKNFGPYFGFHLRIGPSGLM